MVLVDRILCYLLRVTKFQCPVMCCGDKIYASVSPAMSNSNNNFRDDYYHMLVCLTVHRVWLTASQLLLPSNVERRLEVTSNSLEERLKKHATTLRNGKEV